MRALATVLGVFGVVLIFAEFFVAYLLPRRVKRDPRLARRLYQIAWRPWRAVASRLPPTAADTLLGIFGPFGLVAVLAIWVLGLILSYGALTWSASAGSTHAMSFGQAIYASAGSFFSANTGITAHGTWPHALNVVEAASGFAVVFIVIGYLPALYQSFSRREVVVSQLDPRAGSPPTAGALLVRAAQGDGWRELDAYFQEAEVWAAELMETHLSYPLLAYFRSQHVNQNWLAALTAIVDGCAFAIAAAPVRLSGAELTYAIGRHALADLSHTFRARPRAPSRDRLDNAALHRLRDELERAGLALEDDEDASGRRLTDLRQGYEPHAEALASALALRLPDWLAPRESLQNWRRTAWDHEDRTVRG